MNEEFKENPTPNADNGDQRDPKTGLTKRQESRELDRELDDSMDGSDPPSITQP